MALFTEADRKRIEAKIAEVESRTAGEIVVAAVGQSDGYQGRRALHTAGFGILGAALTHHLFLELSADLVLLAELGLFAGLWFVVGLPGLLRRLVPREERREAVEQRAARMFTERGVFDTRDHSGVLIMLSELEHQVVMLGDRGIHARVSTEGWQKHVRHITAAIGAGKAADGVCEVLDALGEVLAEAFPPRPDDTDELPNQVVTEER